MQIYPDTDPDNIISAILSTTDPRINGFDITENIRKLFSFALKNRSLQNMGVSLDRSLFSDNQYDILCHEMNMYDMVQPNRCIFLSPDEPKIKLSIRYSLKTYKARSKKEKIKFKIKNLLRKNNRKFKIEGPHENRVLTITGLGKSGIFR